MSDLMQAVRDGLDRLFRAQDAVQRGGTDMGLKERELEAARQALLDSVKEPELVVEKGKKGK